jgi:hypothetical protein
LVVAAQVNCGRAGGHGGMRTACIEAAVCGCCTILVKWQLALASSIASGRASPSGLADLAGSLSEWRACVAGMPSAGPHIYPSILYYASNLLCIAEHSQRLPPHAACAANVMMLMLPLSSRCCLSRGAQHPCQLSSLLCRYILCWSSAVQVQVCFTSVDGQVQPLDVALGHRLTDPLQWGSLGDPVLCTH